MRPAVTCPAWNEATKEGRGAQWSLGSLPGPRWLPAGACGAWRTGSERVLALIAGGHDNAEIASRLFLSFKTVQNHVSNIFRKLRVAARVQAGLGG